MTQRPAILFDLDGTLIDTTHLILRCFDSAWQTVCGLTPARQSILETFGIPLKEAMHRLVAMNPSPAGCAPGSTDTQLVERLLAEYRTFNAANHDSMARPFKGVRNVISNLRSRGYAIAVVTSKGRDLALRGLRNCSLDEMIDATVVLEDTELHKPQPDPINAGLDRLNVDPGHAAYVGDSPFDMIAGRAAGVRTVAALWGPSSRKDLEREEPDYFAEDVSDLLDIFE